MSKVEQSEENVRMVTASSSRQARRTCTALLDAFRDLFLSRRYADIRVADILRRADVGRSTFYEHFRNKDDLLKRSVTPIIAVLADAVGDDCERQRLEAVLEHFRENVRVTRGFLNGPLSARVVAVLTELIEDRLIAWRAKPAMPLNLAAAQIAGAQLALVRAWLNSDGPCRAQTLAAALHTSTAAMRRALFNGEPRALARG
jgi:AcrR family transcriptional regulator